jgi:hypothetical protein
MDVTGGKLFVAAIFERIRGKLRRCGRRWVSIAVSRCLAGKGRTSLASGETAEPYLM